MSHPGVCPRCKSVQVQVMETRPSGDRLRRRRKCVSCGLRFTSYELLNSDLSRIEDGYISMKKFFDKVKRQVNRFG